MEGTFEQCLHLESLFYILLELLKKFCLTKENFSFSERHCYPYLSAMQPPTRYFSPWIVWNRVPFASVCQ